MNHPGGDCPVSGIPNQYRSNILQNVILRLRPFDLPRGGGVVSKDMTVYHTFMTFFSIINLNILGAMTLISCYLALSHWYEMRISSSFEIIYAMVCLMAVCLIKLFQCFVNYQAGSRDKEDRSTLTYVNNFMFIPCLYILWMGLVCTQTYQNRIFTEVTARMNFIGPQIGKVSDFKVGASFFPEFESIIRYPQDNHVRSAWDYIQTKYSCCGSYGWNDYLHKGLSTPATCYQGEKLQVNQKGCLSAVTTSLYNLCHQIQNTIMWLLIPLEGLLAAFAVLALYTKMNTTNHLYTSEGSGRRDESVYLYSATLDDPVASNQTNLQI